MSETSRTEDDTPGLLGVDSKWYLTAFYVGLLAWLLYLLWSATNWNWTDKLMPYLVGAPAIFLILVKLVDLQFPGLTAHFHPDQSDNIDSTGGNENTQEVKEQYARSLSEDSGRTRRERQKYQLLMVGWVLILPVAIYYLGFTVALPVYVFAFGVFFTGRLAMSLLISVVSSALLFVFFVYILGAQPWGGVLGFPSIVGLLP